MSDQLHAPGALPPGNISGILMTGSLAGLSVSLDTVAKRKSQCPWREFNYPGSSLITPSN
jgi:hypothetical protein